jgi:integrase
MDVSKLASYRFARSRMSTALTEIAADYCLTKGLRPSSAWQVAHSVRLFGRWLGRDPLVSDLNDSTVSRWLEHLELTHSLRTVAGHRANILSIWRYADIQQPRNVRRVRRPDPCPMAWTIAEVQLLIRVAAVQRGELRNGVSKSDYLTTLILAAYDTGLRKSDLFGLNKDSVRPDGSIVLVQSKVGKVHAARLRLAALEGLKRLPGQYPFADPWRNSRAFYRVWAEVIQTAMIRPGCLQQLRRTGASHLAAIHPEAVQRYLGHRSPEMQKHYVDPSIAQPTQPLPPEIHW